MDTETCLPMRALLAGARRKEAALLELIRKLRALPQFKFVPILLLTTDSQPEKKLEGKAAGATGWIVKPFQPQQLLTVVNKVMR